MNMDKAFDLVVSDVMRLSLLQVCNTMRKLSAPVCSQH